MVSREAHPWIYDRSDGMSCGYDVWVGHINRLQLYRTWNRQALGEHNVMYFLDTDAGCHDYGAPKGCWFLILFLFLNGFVLFFF